MGIEPMVRVLQFLTLRDSLTKSPVKSRRPVIGMFLHRDTVQKSREIQQKWPAVRNIQAISKDMD